MSNRLSQATRINYGLMLLVSTLFSVFMMGNWGEEILRDIASKGYGSIGKVGDASAWVKNQVECRKAGGLSAHCSEPNTKPMIPESAIGPLGVLRVAFGSFIFHVVMALLMYGVQNSKDARAKFQNEFWLMKLFMYGRFLSALYYRAGP